VGRVTDAFRLDAGLRRERQTVDYTLDTNDGPYNYPHGTLNLVVPHATASENFYTGAADYEFSNNNVGVQVPRLRRGVGRGPCRSRASPFG
jgi:hypothetical protein